jgi:hypothetical protein
MAQPAPYCVLEYGAKDKSKGYCGIFKLDYGANPYNLRLKGINRSKNYEVTFKNDGETVVMSGLELVNTGINITLESIHNSELILYKNI